MEITEYHIIISHVIHGLSGKFISQESRVTFDKCVQMFLFKQMICNALNLVWRTSMESRDCCGITDIRRNRLNIFFCNFTDKCRIVGCQAFIDMCTGCIHVFGLLKLFILIDAFFDKYLFERREMQGFQYFSFLDFQLLFQQIHRIVCRLFQDFAHSKEMWLTVIDNTTVGRDTYFTVCESVESINRFIR